MAKTIDLYGASLELYFKTKNGTPKTIRNIVFGETTSVHDVSFVSFVQRVKVTINILKLTRMEITLTPPFNEAVALIESGVLGLGFTASSPNGGRTNNNVGDDTDIASTSNTSIDFNTIIVRLFYGGKKSPYFKGVLVPPEFSINTDGITITLKAIGMLFQQTKVSLKESFEDQTRLDILQKALGDDVELLTPSGDAKATEALAQIEQLNANESNMSVIRKILDKTNCVLIDKGMSSNSGTPTLEIVSKDHMRRKKSSAIFVLWNQIDPNNGIYPITALDTTLNNVLLGQTFGINTISVDTSTKEITPADEENSGKNKDDKASNASSPDGSLSGGNTDDSLLDKIMNKAGPNRGEKHNLKDTLIGAVKLATDSTLQYKLETVGLVDLLPGRSVTVKIADIKFLSGAYDLYEVEHEFSTEGVSTRLNLSRTGGLAAAITKGVEKVQSATSAVTDNNKSSSGLPLIGGGR